MFATIPLVTGIFSLLAFVAAIALLAYRARLNQDVALLKSANNETSLKALDRLTGRFNIDTSGLTKAQQYELVNRQIQLQSQRQLLAALVVMGIAFLLAIVAVAFILRPQPDNNQTTNGPNSPIIDDVSGDVTISVGG